MPDQVGPVCPSCRQPLKENLRHTRIDSIGSQESEPRLPAFVAFCGACGSTLMTELTGRRIAAPPRVDGEVASPDDEDSTSGRFQLRCRELIGEIRSVGFEPGGWIGLINRLGAVGAAKQLIETHRILPVTRFLVGQGRPDLTMEHEMCDSKWSELFTEAECDEARRRLASVEGNGGGTPSRR